MKTFLWMIVICIFPVAFNAVFFTAGGTVHEMSTWISYGFIHFAYLMLLLTPLFIREGKNAGVFGFPLFSISSLYFFVELCVGVVCILISPRDATAAFLVQLVIAGLYGIAVVPNLIANEYTADAEETRQRQIDYVKSASARLESLLEKIDDKETKKKVERVYDAVYSSPVKSHPNLEQMEMRILESIRALETAVFTGNGNGITAQADSLEAAINERNRRLKMLN